MLRVLLQCLLLYTAASTEDIPLETGPCVNGSTPTAVLVTSLGGDALLIQKTNYIIDHLLMSAKFKDLLVRFASFVSRDGRSTMDTPFCYQGEYNVTEFREWDWCDIDSYNRAGLIVDAVNSFSRTEDALRIEQRYIAVVIDSVLNESKSKFFEYLENLKSNDTIVIPIDVTEANGRHEINELAKAGGFTASGCLLCGGLSEEQLVRCEEELRLAISCL